LVVVRTRQTLAPHAGRTLAPPCMRPAMARTAGKGGKYLLTPSPPPANRDEGKMRERLDA